MDKARDGQVPFKDYCLILQLHPDADVEMVDAAYWHLARRYSDALGTDPTAKARLDDLNEAYSVMRASDRREQYERLRAEVLGAGALPKTPEPSPEPVPLAVMERGRDRLQSWSAPEEDALKKPNLGKVTGPGLQTAFVAAIMVLLGIVAFSPLRDPALAGVALAIGLAALAIPLYRRLPSLSASWLGSESRSETIDLPAALAGTAERDREFDPQALRESTLAVSEKWRRGGRKLSVIRGGDEPSVVAAPASDDANAAA